MSTSPLSRREVLIGVAASALASTKSSALAAANFCAPNFLVIGDWGRDGALHQADVARQMAIAAEQVGSRFVISVGDNFYENGVRSTFDPQWRSSFEAIYSARSLQIPWYVALGNHDYRGAPQAQIDYSKISARWRMPKRYFKVAGSEVAAPYADFFFIDTSPFVHQYREEVESAIASNVRGQNVDAQLRWLDDQLGRSRAPWKLVIGHHTLRSGGSAHGDTPELVERIEPLLRKHRVQTYFNGHDHDMQHIHRDGVDYICCGAGSEGRPVNAVDGTRFCLARSGFALVKFEPEMMRVEFRDYFGATVYETAIVCENFAARRASPSATSHANAKAA